ncbi:MFS general substrate transporter [Aspergillus ambiguus]|uniref:MDR family MFS transporter n=1 Tax=Aspergillus ambiguus TaxID=176160 RepID=UPI003CCCDDAA
MRRKQPDTEKQSNNAPDHLPNQDVERKTAKSSYGEDGFKAKETYNQEYPSGLRLALLLVALYASLFLVSLDRLIISTAIPVITDQFHSITDVGWYGAAYQITSCAFQLLWGKVYSLFSVKGTFLVSILLFEIGSAICGAAPNSLALIVGRAVAGLGSGGVMSGTIVIMVYAVPLHKRPLYNGLFGAIFGISSVAGPLLGGVFTSTVTWRWCFYINLPFGGVTILLVAYLLHVPDGESTKVPLRKKILQLDFAGITFLLPGIVCLTLALQWGGVTYPWSEGHVVALLVLTGACFAAFALVQVLLPDTATISTRILYQRSILAGLWASFCIGSQIFVYFLPIWFQAIKSVSAINSGIYLLPLILPMFFASIISGGLISRIGYYTPFMIAGNCIMAVGAGLLTTLQVETQQGEYIGYQVLYGFGLGNMLQISNLAAQTVLQTSDIPVGVSLLSFGQQLGGAIFVSVGQTVLTNELAGRLKGLHGFEPSMLTKVGATSLIDQLPNGIRDKAVAAYNNSLRTVFQVGLIIVCLTMLGSIGLEWRSFPRLQTFKLA